MVTQRSDAIYPLTRFVAALVVPFLVLAFIILYFFPQLSGERFAWDIQPALTAVYMGAGYIGGAWLFLNVIFGKHWHRVAAGFPAVTAFTAAMLLATILHWQRFDLDHLPFQLWLALYLLTPLLVPALLIYNRKTDNRMPEADDLVVPIFARWGLGFLGLLLLIFAVVGFILPDLVIRVWPWTLTPLTSRVISGWIALLGVGGIVIASESRWSAWRIGLQSIAIWHILVIAGAVVHRGDFQAGFLNWYTLSVLIVILLMSVLYIRMEIRR